MKRLALVIAAGVVIAAPVISAATLQQIRLAEGRDETNRIATPIFDDQGMSIEFAITAAYDRKAKFVRRTGGRLPATRGPEYDLNAGVDIAALLTESLRTEAAAMGLHHDGRTERAWRVAGTIKQVFLESRQVYMGATLFYGFLEVEFVVTGPGGASATQRLRTHNYSAGYNAGIGRRDEAESAAAHLMVEGAQEILARLNRTAFKVPASIDAGAMLARLSSGLKNNLAELRALGLSGLPRAAPPLLDLLAKEQTESLRAAVVDALASLGAPAAVAPLASRYATEDEDPRWYTLKAMDYIGGPEAATVVESAGLKDEDAGPKRLATRIAAR